MNDRFEVSNIDEVEEELKRFNDFHDDCITEIEIKFENYKDLDEDGASTGIRNADKTIILTVNTYPYGKEHKQFVQVEFKEVKAFEIFSSAQDSGPEAGPTWEISHTLIEFDGVDIEWEFGFICGDAKFLVICSKIVFLKQNS